MELFKFSKEDVTTHIEYELKTLSKFKEPLNYVINYLIANKHSMIIKSLDGKIDLNKVKELEGKNYHWSTFIYENITLVVRRYHQHLTIFTKVINGVDRYEKTPKAEYGAFTLNTDFDKFGDDKHDEMMDKYYDKHFIDLNVIIADLLKLLSEKNGVHWVWNSASLKRPKHVDINLIFSGNSIDSIDNFIFCMEELETIYIQAFSETTMIQRLQELKSGDSLTERYKIGKIITDIKNDYYHSVGIEIIDGKDKSFKDVYCLTRYYFDDMFKDKIYMYGGEIYVEGDSFKEGKPVAYKNLDDKVTLYQKTFPKENFVPLKKY